MENCCQSAPICDKEICDEAPNCNSGAIFTAGRSQTAVQQMFPSPPPALMLCKKWPRFVVLLLQQNSVLQVLLLNIAMCSD